MQNGPSHSGNPRLPDDLAALNETEFDAAEDNAEKSEEEKAKDSRPEDQEPFNVDKVDDLEASKKGEKED